MLRASLVSEKNVYFPQATREREREREISNPYKRISNADFKRKQSRKIKCVGKTF